MTDGHGNANVAEVKRGEQNSARTRFKKALADQTAKTDRADTSRRPFAISHHLQ